MAQQPVPRAPSTLRDVAAAAGVSIATASRVLSGNPATSAAAREAVTTAAADLGFRPNAQARALRSSRTGSIGLLIPDIRNPHFADLAHSVERHARDRGMVTLVSASDECLATQETALGLLISHNVDGLIVVPQGQGDSPEGPEILGDVVRAGIPLVLVDRMVPGLEVPAVVPDSNGITEAMAALIRLGHERVGLIAGPASSSTGRERRAAYESALASAGRAVAAELIYEGDFQPESGRIGMEQLMDLPEPSRPDAVIVADGPMAVGAMSALRERGIRVPEDISVVAHDDLEAFRLCDPPLSAVAQDVEAMGAAAVEMLLGSTGEPQSRRGKGTPVASGVTAGLRLPPETVRQPTHFVLRGSVRNVSPRAAGRSSTTAAKAKGGDVS